MMNRNSSDRRAKSEKRIKETISKAKNVFNKAFRTLASLALTGYNKLPKSRFSNQAGSNKTQKMDSFNTSFSEKCDADPMDMKQDHITTPINHSDFDNEFVAENRGVVSLARKMKELDMMNVNEMDHVLDIEEALSYYSRLTCPAYQQIVDKFFMDMYMEFYENEQPSRSLGSSMRKPGKNSSSSLHGSWRSLGPLKL